MLRYECFARPTASEVLAHEFFADLESPDVQRSAERVRLLVFERISPPPSRTNTPNLTSSAIAEPEQPIMQQLMEGGFQNKATKDSVCYVMFILYCYLLYVLIDVAVLVTFISE